MKEARPKVVVVVVVLVVVRAVNDEAPREKAG
jgi:hypothetical protein